MWSRFHIWIIASDLIEDPAEEGHRRQNIRLVDERDMAPALAREFKRGPRDSLGTAARDPQGIRFEFTSGRPGRETVHKQPFAVLPHQHEIDRMTRRHRIP